MNSLSELEKSYILCTLSPVRQSSFTMTSIGLNKSGQKVLFAHLNNIELSLMMEILSSSICFSCKVSEIKTMKQILLATKLSRILVLTLTV